ncbi:MAG: LPS assembly protein LptD [Acetobacteraceae bacterium]|nr:LPS assembly protein LptD [Acetobacteraceae bacterium]
MIFTAGEVLYDERQDLVIARGGVEAWQGERILRAREITFQRRTGRAAARGDVVLMEPDGQVLFAEEAELTEDLREGVIRELRALLAEGGRLAAPAAVRSEGRFTDMRRAVYTTCEACPRDPLRPPLWQIRANRVVHDEEDKIVEYFDTTLQVGGVPVLYVPYFWHADPAVRRKSGFLVPQFGRSSYLGPYFRQPYYWVISPSADATLAPLITGKRGPALFGEYRQRFNAGLVTLQGSGARDTRDDRWRGHVFGTVRLTVNDTFRTGLDLQRSSDNTYLRRYRIGSLNNQPVLVSTPFLEGFSQSAYLRADAFFFQGLGSEDDDRRTPIVLPRLFAEFRTEPDRLGGVWAADAGVFVAARRQGTDTQRIASRLNYRLPWQDSVGQVWTLEGNLDLIGYAVRGDPQSTPVPGGLTGEDGRVQPQIALTWRWPWLRPGGAWGSQLVEPIVQGVVGPNRGRNPRIPNEDSVDLEFTDASLFGFNRFPGRDRLDGGARLNAGLRGAWYLPGGPSVEGLFGQAFRAAADDLYPAGSGLEGRRSDYVARLTVVPSQNLSLSYRTRLDRERLSTELADVSTTLSGFGRYVTLSYLTAPAQPESLQPIPRREIAGTVGGRIATHWSGFFGARRDLAREQMVASFGGLRYEDECFVFSLTYLRRFTTLRDGVTGFSEGAGTDLLFTIIFKTVGEFGFSAL